MPELPEVETVARQLAPLVTGREARSLVVFDAKLKAAARDDLRGRRVASVARRGKEVVIEFAASRGAGATRAWLGVHLRMTGRLQWQGAVDAEDRPHRRASLRLAGGTVDFFDPRRFGTLSWASSLEDLGPIGLDPMTAAFTTDALAELLAGSPQPLKAWLLRQDRLVGLGNIYASEILHAARLHPLRAAGSLSDADVDRLHASTRHILSAAIDRCGTTFSDFQDAHGLVGGFQSFLRVYDREGESCSRCGKSIRRIVQQQRSTYFCPGCAGPARRTVRSGRLKKKERPDTDPA